MFSKRNIHDIPTEGTSHAFGSRQMIVAKEDTTSEYFEALTYGYLPSGVKWEMHKHNNMVEVCIVVKGEGVIRDSSVNEETFISGDRFIFPSDTEHEIENNSDEVAEFYFLRFKDR